jgi:DNA-binding NtrC family response regulator
MARQCQGATERAETDDALSEGEETVDDLLNPPINQQHNATFKTADSIPSITDDLWRVNGEKVPNLSALSLKKICKKVVNSVEREVISYVLEKTGWNRTRAVKILNISYKTLLYKIKELGISSPESDNQSL